MENIISWDHYFLDMCWHIAQRSRDPSTKVGAVITTQDHQVVSQGYNGFPRGVKNSPERWEQRPDKYSFIVHAERNAIYNAVRQGRSTEGCRMYLFYDSLPCEQCTLSVIQSGISEYVMGSVPFPGQGNGTWYDTETHSKSMMDESNMILRRVTDWTPPPQQGYAEVITVDGFGEIIAEAEARGWDREYPCSDDPDWTVNVGDVMEQDALDYLSCNGVVVVELDNECNIIPRNSVLVNNPEKVIPPL